VYKTSDFKKTTHSIEKGFILKSLYNPSILPENSQQDKLIKRKIRSELEKMPLTADKLL
jgi:hypothetical protein